MLLNTKKIILRAQQEGYAVPAFNVHNLENIRGVVKAAVELKSPLILSCTPSTFRFSGMRNIVEIVKAQAKQYKHVIPITLHMDHHKDFDMIKEGLKLGIKSIMIDASSLSFEENIKMTKKVVHLSRLYDATIEAELGVIPGVEDELIIEHKLVDDSCTKPVNVVKFVSETLIDSLAISIGNAHGIYHSKPVLNINRLEEVKQVCDIPLVLHGGSGLTKEQIRSCIKNGVAKVNIGTQLKAPFANAIKKYFKENPNVVDPRLYFEPAVEAVRKCAIEKILICMSENRY